LFANKKPPRRDGKCPLWVADNPVAPAFVRYWTKAGLNSPSLQWIGLAVCVRGGALCPTDKRGTPNGSTIRGDQARKSETWNGCRIRKARRVRALVVLMVVDLIIEFFWWLGYLISGFF
jgi:hypothetical protein